MDMAIIQDALDRLKFKYHDIHRIIIETPRVVWDKNFGLEQITKFKIRVIFDNFGHLTDFEGDTLEKTIERACQ